MNKEPVTAELERIANKYAITPIKAVVQRVDMIDYDGEPVPEALCTVGRLGGADDFLGCGKCFENDEGEGTECAACVVNKIFKQYAELTGQCKEEE